MSGEDSMFRVSTSEIRRSRRRTDGRNLLLESNPGPLLLHDDVVARMFARTSFIANQVNCASSFRVHFWLEEYTLSARGRPVSYVTERYLRRN